jgi:preprotein translocase subunit SecG
MFVTIIVLTIIVCVLLILVVLIQNPKGGGISANFASGNKIMGVKRTNDFIEKATWTLVIGLFVLSMASNMFSTTERSAESALKKQFEDNGVPQVETPIQQNLPQGGQNQGQPEGTQTEPTPENSPAQ